jgi:phage baseplate assembly protein V
MTTIRDVGELERTRGTLLRIGTVSEVDAATARVRVRLDEVPTALLPVLNPRHGADRVHWLPSVGEQVMLFAPDGEPSNGVVLGGVAQTAHPAPRRGSQHATVYRDTAVQQYDPATGVYHIELPADGPAGEPMIVLTAPTILLRTNRLRKAPYTRTFTDQPQVLDEDYVEPSVVGSPCC